MKRIRNLGKCTAGVAAIEFALVFPVLLLLIAGIIEYGRVLFVEQAVRNIIDGAARTGVITALTASEVSTLVEDQIVDVPGIEDYEVTITDGAELGIAVTGMFSLAFSGFLPADTISFSMTTQFPR